MLILAGTKILFVKGEKRYCGNVEGYITSHLTSDSAGYIVKPYGTNGELMINTFDVPEKDVLQIWSNTREEWLNYEAVKNIFSTFGPQTDVSNIVYDRYILRLRNIKKIHTKGASSVKKSCKYLPIPNKIIYSGPATVVMWTDGTKTVVKLHEGETDDREKAFMYCVFKKIFDKKSDINRYFEFFEALAVKDYDRHIEKEVLKDEEKEN